MALAACAPKPIDLASAHQQTVRFPIYYQLDTDRPKPNDTLIAFYEDEMRYFERADLLNPSKQSEFGGGFEVKSSSSGRFMDRIPVFAPTRGAASISNDRAHCTAIEDTTGFTMDCRLARGRYLSRYEFDVGVIWFDYHCSPFSSEICRYKLASPLGYFSPGM
jgi:hypothetical protein